jgi:transglutaminase-like putative cysteine protease
LSNSNSLLIATTLLFLLAACQPDSDQSESQTPKKGKEKVRIEDVDKGIRDNIESRILEGDGYFNFQNDTLDLSLKLVRVHTEYLSILGPNKFFACVDLATENGDVYDVDFFLDGIPGDMLVSREVLHKLNGKPYYTWKQRKDKTWFTIPLKKASNKLLGVIEGKDRFTFSYEVQLPVISKPAQLWIPVAQSDSYQKIELKLVKAPGQKQMLKEDDYGNSILYLELLPKHSNENVIIDYAVERIEKSPYRNGKSDPDKYLEESTFLPVGGRFFDIAQEVIREKQAQTPLTKARALYDYIIDNMRYAKEGTYGTGDANYACDARSGNCTEFHSFFISLARSAGIPARFAVGAAIPSERNDGKVDGYHCWAEFYAEGKWWPIDISEANKYTPLATYYFGHHPANRIEFSRGRDLQPEPTPASGPINFLAFPVFELDGKPEAVKTTFSFRRVAPVS